MHGEMISVLTRWLVGAAAAGAVACMALGCAGTDTPPANDAAGANNASASSPATAAAGAPASNKPSATFSAVYDMMFPMMTNARCNACHANPANDVANGKLQTGMDKASAYAALVGKTSMSSRCMSRPLVVPSQPDSSLFYLKLMPNPPCGVRMPNGGNAFTNDQLEMVRSWIAGGAKDD